MSKFKMGHSRFSQFMSGKGFYIALALCLVAIGSAAYIAANGTFKNLGAGVASSSDTASVSSADSNNAAGWDGAEQTANTVSGVTGSRSSSSSETSSAPASSQAVSSAPASSAPAAAPTYYTMPVTGDIITAYSPTTPIYDKTMDDWRVSDCVDIAADEGAPVKACADGTVLDVKVDSMLGQEVIIQHSGGLQSIYANLSDQVAVKKGQKVQAGTVIGAVGQSAQSEISLVPHLHFEMMQNGQPVDPLVTIKSTK